MKKLILLIVFAGCLFSCKKENDDGVTITISKGFVNVFVEITYSEMKIPFETHIETINNVVYMYITDMCHTYDGMDGCYGRGFRHYTFDFVFKYQDKNQMYKILLITPQDEPVIISQGKVK